MRLPQFRLRTLMIVVAAVAVGLGLWVRSERYRRIGKEHARNFQVWMDRTRLDGVLADDQIRRWHYLVSIGKLPAKAVATMAGDEIRTWQDLASIRKPPAKLGSMEQRLRDVEAEFYRRKLARLEYHETMYLKYRYYASHPWFPVPPDPPEPN